MNDQDYQKILFTLENLNIRISQMNALYAPLVRKIEDLERKIAHIETETQY